MAEVGLGAGLGAMGFWLFIGIAVCAGVWNAARKREAQHETLRSIIVNEKNLDPDMIEKLMNLADDEDDSPEDLATGLTVAGYIILALAPGLMILGWFVGALGPLTGVAGLLACLGAGFLFAAKKVFVAEDIQNKQ